MGRLCVAIGAAVALWLVGATSHLPAAGAAGSPGTAVVGPAAGRSGWVWPLAGRPPVVRGFSAPATPYGPGHRGVDLAALAGSPVFAAGAGIVGYVGTLAGRGVVTVLHADGLRTTYEPVLGSVHPGRHVAAGDRLGALVTGHLDCAPAACLHWGLLRGRTYLDPLMLLGRGQVRLLPQAGRPAAAPVAGGPSPRRRQPAAGPAGEPGRAGWPRPGAVALLGGGLLAAAGSGAAVGWRQRSRRGAGAVRRPAKSGPARVS